MFTKQDIINSFTTEVAICKHLASKIPADKYDFTPGENMRSIKELLEYMVRMGTSPIAILDGYDPEEQTAFRIAAEEGDVTKNFNAMMDTQLAEIISFVEGVSEEYLEGTVELFGATQRRKDFFFHVSVKNFPAYRMQLFQYLKGGLGMSDLNTSNLWMGKDA